MKLIIQFLSIQLYKKSDRLIISENIETGELLEILAAKLQIDSKKLFVKIKRDGYTLRIVKGWNIQHYDFKDGTILLVEQRESQNDKVVKNKEKLFAKLGLHASSTRNVHGSIDSTNRASSHQDEENQSVRNFLSSSSYDSEDNNNIHQVDIKKLLDYKLENLLRMTKNGKKKEVIEILDDLSIHTTKQQRSDIQKQLVNEIGLSGWNPFHFAVFFNFIDIIQVYVDKGADINKTTSDGWSPLQIAIHKNHQDVVNYLLTFPEIDINLVTSRGAALHIACAKNNIKIIQLILKNGADPSESDQQEDIKNQNIKNCIEIQDDLEKDMFSSKKIIETLLKLQGIPKEEIIQNLEKIFQQSQQKEDQNQIQLQQAQLNDNENSQQQEKQQQQQMEFPQMDSSNIFFEKQSPQLPPIPLTQPYELNNNNNNKESIEKINFINNSSILKEKIKYRHFTFQKLIGEGSFGKVFQAFYADKIYAIKVIKKKFLFHNNQLRYAVNEAKAMMICDHQFILSLHYAFQTPRHIYLAMDMCSGGDFSQLLAHHLTLNETDSKFYIAQLLLAIQHLHKNDIIHRDIKPENILIYGNGYIKLGDFGLCKLNVKTGYKAKTFCGSLAYVSPEMLNKEGVGKMADIYGVGAILYEILTGDPPYYNDDESIMEQQIKEGKLILPEYITEKAQSILKRLLEIDPLNRISIEECLTHPFFDGFDWELLQNQKQTPPITDFSYLDLDSDDDLEIKTFQMFQRKCIFVDQDYEERNYYQNRIRDFSFVRTNKQKSTFEE